MNNKFQLLFIVLIIACGHVASQEFDDKNKNLIDSLYRVAKNPNSHDTSALRAYLKISDLLYHQNIDTLFYFTQKVRHSIDSILKTNPPEDVKTRLLKNLALAYLNEGYALERKSRVAEAIRFYEKSLSISRKVNDSSTIAYCYNNLGYIFQKQGDIKKALSYHSNAIEINKKIHQERGVVFSLLNIGHIYYNQNDPEKAYESWVQALQMSLKHDFKEPQAFALGNLGYYFKNKGNDTLALDYYERALKIHEQINNQIGISNVLNYIANLQNDRRNVQKALELHFRALKIREKEGFGQGIVSSLNNIGRIYLANNQIKKAEKTTQRSYEIAKKSGYTELLRDVSLLLSEIYETQNKGMLSLKFYKQYDELKDSLINKETQQASFKQQAKYEYEKQKAIDDLKYEKQIAIEKKEKANQQIIIYTIIIVLILVTIFLMIISNRLKITRRQKNVIEKQKQVLAENNQQLFQKNEEISTQRDNLEKQKKVIEEIHRELGQSIDYAMRIQQSVLPNTAELNKYFNNSFVLFLPKDKVSGDFYWWTHVENQTIITAADCTGHGVPGAIMSMLGTSFLREIVQKEKTTDSGVILHKLRQEIIKVLKQKGEEGEQKDGMDMALISLNHQNQLVQFSGANNPLYVITKDKRILDGANYNVDFEGLNEFKPDKMPIAIYEKLDPFSTQEFKIQKGDRLFIFSDGFADQFGGTNGKKYKYKPFKRLLLNTAELDLQNQKQMLLQEFQRWKGDLDQVDDVVILGVEI